MHEITVIREIYICRWDESLFLAIFFFTKCNAIIVSVRFVKLRQGSGKDRQGMALKVKAKGLKA